MKKKFQKLRRDWNNSVRSIYKKDSSGWARDKKKLETRTSVLLSGGERNSSYKQTKKESRKADGEWMCKKGLWK